MRQGVSCAIDSAGMVMELAPLNSNDSIDDKMIRWTVEGLSPEAISERLGEGLLTPAEVRYRVAKALSSPNWLTEAQQELALMMVMRKNLAKIQQFLDGGVDDKALALSLSYIKEIFARLDKRASVTQVKVDQYNENVGRTIGHVVDLALTYMKGALRSEVDPDRWDELVHEALRMAQVEIEKKQIKQGAA